jgi:hypothetical protein
MKPEEYSRRQTELVGWAVWIETYKLGLVYYCTVSNVDPGARFARGEASTRDGAERLAMERASKYLSRTRKFDV